LILKEFKIEGEIYYIDLERKKLKSGKKIPSPSHMWR
jgi:hypothetical protein